MQRAGQELVEKAAVFNMPYGQYGGASFAPTVEPRRRHFLWRAWPDEPLGVVSVQDQQRLDLGQWHLLSKPFALFIGHNPSKADGKKNDMTIIREVSFTARLERSYLVKLNVSDICATDPQELDRYAVPTTQDNCNMIMFAAEHAADIVFASGNPHKCIYSETVVLMQALIRAHRDKVKCLGLTSTGWPRHPSRLGGGTPFVALEGALRQYDALGKA